MAVMLSIINMLEKGLTTIDLVLIVCLLYILLKLEELIIIIIEEIISLFSKKHKETFLLNLEWYNPNYLLFRSDLTNIVAKVRGLKNGSNSL